MIRHGLSRFLLFSATVALLLLAGERQSLAAGDFWKGTLAVQQGDCDTALTEFRALADDEDARGWAMMGHMHLRGTCLTKDPLKAVEFFEKAAELGNDAAVVVLFKLYQGNGGVPADRAKAMQWLTKAAERGSADAAYRLSVVLGKSDNPDRDLEKSDYWLEHAALRKHGTAQVALGARLAMEGKLDSAVMWAILALTGGDKRADPLLKVLRKDATAEEFAQGEARAAKCLASEYGDCDSD